MPEETKSPEPVISTPESKEATTQPTSEDKSSDIALTPESPTDVVNRRLVPVNTATVGRSIKLRDLDTISGTLVADSTPVSVTAVSNSEADLKSFTFFPNELHKGLCIRITARGTWIAPDIKQLVIRIGSGLAPVTEWQRMTATGGTSTAGWSLVWIGIVATIGTSGTLESQFTGIMSNNHLDDPNESTFTIDTTANLTIGLTAQWTNVDFSRNTMSVRQWIVEVLH